MNNLVDLKLKGFPILLWHSVFQCDLLQFKYGFHKYSRRECFRQIGKLLLVSFFSRERYLYNNCNSHIIFYQSYITRTNVTECLNNIRSLVKSDLISTSFGSKDFKFKEGVNFLLNYFPSWSKELRKRGFTIAERVMIINELVVLYRLYEVLESIDITRYKLLVTYYDSPTNESFVVEYFKSKGIKTASLQHGQFTGWCDDTFMDCGIELKTFKSDYLLCWNQYTVDEAIKMGINPSHLVITGIWSYVKKERIICKKNRNGVFGIVISHPDWDMENREMVKAANILAENYGFKYYLKLHPYYKETAFDDAVNSCYVGNIQRSISLIDYANNMDFTIVGSSSVYMELAFIEHDVYHYSSGQPKDKFKNILVGKNFRSAEELRDIYETMKNKNCSKDLFDYLCTIYNVTDEYKLFFERFV